MFIRRRKFNEPSFVISYSLGQRQRGMDSGKHPMLGADDDDRFDVLSGAHESCSPYYDGEHDELGGDEGAVIFTSQRGSMMDFPGMMDLSDLMDHSGHSDLMGLSEMMALAEMMEHCEDDEDHHGIDEILHHILGVHHQDHDYDHHYDHDYDDEDDYDDYDDLLDHIARRRHSRHDWGDRERYQLGAMVGSMASQALPAMASSAGSSFGAGMGSAAADKLTKKKGPLGGLLPFSKGGRVASRGNYDDRERYQLGAIAGMAAKALPAMASQALPAMASSAGSSFGSGMGSAAANQLTSKKSKIPILGSIPGLNKLLPFSKGGRVANYTPAIAGCMPNEFDDLVLRDYLESTYGDYDNAGDDLGNAQQDQERQEILDLIRRQRSMRQRNPRPA